MPKTKILIVEDEIIPAKDIQTCLRKLGYTVSGIASSGEEAIQKASEICPDLVLMDIKLKGDMNGIEAAKQIKESFSIPIVYLTAYADDATLQAAKITEPYGYILKPFEERDIHINIEIALYKHKMEMERKQLLSELKRKSKELEQVVYITSHDFRSPLVNIQGFSKELEEAFGEVNSALDSKDIPSAVREKLASVLQDDIPEALKYIVLSTSKLDSLVSGLLQLSRVGGKIIKTRQLDMNELMSNVVNGFKYRANEMGVTLDFDELPSCRGDEGLINQVFSNLLENALKFLDQGRKGIIKISGQKVKEQVEYCVEDNGIGIAVEDQRKIYEIFQRLNPDDSGKGEGLGLAIVRRILDRHDGKIWVESEPGKGAKFFVSLPERNNELFTRW